MKKNKKIKLSLNKSVVSNLKSNKIRGGTGNTCGCNTYIGDRCDTELTCPPESVAAWPAPCPFG